MSTNNAKQTTKKQIAKKQTKKQKTNAKKTQIKNTLSTEPFVVMSVKLPDKTIVHKRFRQSKQPTHVVITQRPSGEYHILCWTTSEKLAERHHDRVIDQYIDPESAPERFLEQKYVDITITTPKFEFVETDEQKLDPKMKEDRSIARNIRKLKRLAAATALALPFLNHIGNLDFSDVIRFLPLS